MTSLLELIVRQLRYSLNYDLSFDLYQQAFEERIESAPAVAPERVFGVMSPRVSRVDGEGYGYTKQPARKVHSRPFHAIFTWADEQGYEVERIDLTTQSIRLKRSYGLSPTPNRT
jgi:hypothetical protein